MTGLRGNPGYSSVCSVCGKQSFTSKALAKRMAKRVDATMRVYFCESSKGWHMGHLPRAVLRGITDRRTFYGTYKDEDEDDDV